MATKPEWLNEPRPISAWDLVGGIVMQAALQGWLSFKLDTPFYSSMWQAFEHLKAEVGDEQLDFRIRPHPIHGDSPMVHDEVLTLMSLRVSMPGPYSRGVFRTINDPEGLEDLLELNQIDRDLLRRLTRQFMDEFHLPLADRTWPEGWRGLDLKDISAAVIGWTSPGLLTTKTSSSSDQKEVAMATEDEDTAPPMPDWAPPNGPWCLKNWAPLRTPNPKYDTCLLPPEHKGDCRGIHDVYHNHDTSMFLGQLKMKDEAAQGS